jgi:catechol 2,3-dioxygenase-like lactoylglutathione lyase family enzyme
LCQLKLRIKVSGCMRSMADAETFCAIRPHLATAARQGIGWLDALTRAARPTRGSQMPDNQHRNTAPASDRGDPARPSPPAPVPGGRSAMLRFVFGSPQVNFYVQDVEVSARFYRESFGFTETFRTPADGQPVHAELRLSEFTLGLAAIDSLREVHGITAGSGPPRAEVVVWTDNVDQAYAVLAASNVRTLSAPHDFLGSLRAAWVADPDGNPVQIVMRRQRKSG